jgi:hypothetical protein
VGAKRVSAFWLGRDTVGSLQAARVGGWENSSRAAGSGSDQAVPTSVEKCAIVRWVTVEDSVGALVAVLILNTFISLPSPRSLYSGKSKGARE